MTNAEGILFAFLAVCLGLGIARIAHGEPPAGANPMSEMGQWYRSLTQPGSGASCCDLSDCRPVRARSGAAGYEVFISSPAFPVQEDIWVTVPAERILVGKDNPTGRPVVCWTPNRGVICFVRGTEG